MSVGAMPVGWYAQGDSTGDYAVGTDRSRRDGGQGQAGGTIRSLTHDPQGFATPSSRASVPPSSGVSAYGCPAS
jgi:hypothetical protein